MYYKKLELWHAFRNDWKVIEINRDFNISLCYTLTMFTAFVTYQILLWDWNSAMEKGFNALEKNAFRFTSSWPLWSQTSWPTLVQIMAACRDNPDSKVHGANMGPIWGRQDPGGPHVGPMNFAIWEGITLSSDDLSAPPALFHFFPGAQGSKSMLSHSARTRVQLVWRGLNTWNSNSINKPLRSNESKPRTHKLSHASE